MENNLVEITEEYADGVLIRITANGLDLPILLPLDECKSITFKKMMSREDVEKLYGKKIK